MLAAGLAGCNDANSRSPTAPSATPPQQTPRPTPGGPVDAVADVTLSGAVYEVAPTGPVPVEGVRVFLSDDQDVNTDTDGFFSFRPVWVCPCAHHPGVAAGDTVIWVGKDGYDDPEGAPVVPGFNGPGWRAVTINGDTRLEVQLVRR